MLSTHCEVCFSLCHNFYCSVRAFLLKWSASHFWKFQSLFFKLNREALIIAVVLTPIILNQGNCTQSAFTLALNRRSPIYWFAVLCRQSVHRRLEDPAACICSLTLFQPHCPFTNLSSPRQSINTNHNCEPINSIGTDPNHTELSCHCYIRQFVLIAPTHWLSTLISLVMSSPKKRGEGTSCHHCKKRIRPNEMLKCTRGEIVPTNARKRKV